MELLIVVLLVFVTGTLSKPQLIFDFSARVEPSNNTCPEGLIYWAPEGECYEKGERGPCEVGQVLWSTETRPLPTCIPFGPTSNPRTVTSTTERVTTRQSCHDENKITWSGDGSCYSLLTQGPCETGHWLQLAEVQVEGSSVPEVECALQKCPDSGTVWWPELCQCVGQFNSSGPSVYGAEQICGKGGQLVVTPHGEGACACRQDPPHAEADDGVCYELDTQGPCEDEHIWARGNEGEVECVKGFELKERFFDILPSNPPIITATQNTCSQVDSRGRCVQGIKFKRRRRVNKNGRRGGSRRGRRQAEADGGLDTEEFLNWIQTFARRSSSGECKVPLCEDDTVAWVDGKCYQLASQGPCRDGSWLVLHSVISDNIVTQCEKTRCTDDQVWWPETCSCVGRGRGANLCPAQSDLAIGPYGEGVCASTEGIVRRVFDIIPDNADDDGNVEVVKRCHVDENGRCRRTLGRRTRNTPRGAFEDLIEWLEGFNKRTKLNTEGNCFFI